LKAALRSRIPLFACALAVALPLAALAQEAAPQLEEDPRAARFREVERGIFVGFEAGYLSLFKTPLAKPANYNHIPADGGGRSGGIAAGLHLGYDLTPQLALSLFFMDVNQSASLLDYGAFDLLTVGLDGRYAFLSWKDAYQVTRLHTYVHARAGYLRSHPDGLFGAYADSGIFRRSDILIAGGPGIEYYTRLRHFSVGLSIDAVYVLHAGVFGFEVLPTMRYTF
jgi:hypothetical protein